MKHAIRLLRQTTEPVKNVAWMCGYKTYPGFWRAFKMHFGQRPTAITRPAGYSIPLVLMDWKMPPSENLKNQLLLAFRDSPWLLRFFRLMLERFDEDRFTLKDLAFELDSSPPQVIRKLNEFLGISPMRLRQHLRLLFAAELLNDSTKSITEVAHTVGFHDQAHLCKSFKAVFGLTPSAYRQNSKVQYELSWLRDPVSGKW